ncbi:claudin 10-like 2 [Osmerus eperlanus]|uniref:claudin 10-like 2 n=1 Tax=Osmerus eperlanus TaxID=29151 RepID=UPI002E127154
MWKRKIQLSGFLISSLGWVFVLCTMAMDYWRVSQVGGTGGSFIIKVAWFWSNLWKDCFTDSSGISNCRDFPVLWSVTAYVQGVRGLLMCGLGLGFFGILFCFLGMECTYLGGEDQMKDKLLLAGSVFHFVGGLADIAGYCLYINRIAKTNFSGNQPRGTLIYDLGEPVFLGLVASFFILLGAILYAVTVYRILFPKSPENGNGTQTYMAARSRGQTLYNGTYRPSRLYSRQYGSYKGSGRSSSYQLSTISKTSIEKMSERDAFV